MKALKCDFCDSPATHYITHRLPRDGYSLRTTCDRHAGTTRSPGYVDEAIRPGEVRPGEPMPGNTTGMSVIDV